MRKFVAALALAFSLTGCGMFEKYEEPSFTLLKKEGSIELRDYKPFLIAEVITNGPRDEAANEGFRHLAGYIFGGNAPKEKMAMTVPVFQQKKGDGWVMHFVMPLDKTIETLPKPDDGRVSLKEMPAGKMLAIVFSGSSQQTNLDTHEAQLRAFAQKSDIGLKEGPLYAFYNSPFSLPFMRRNEILFAVE